MDRYPKSNSLVVVALPRAGCAFRSFSSADKLWQQKVFAGLMLFQGVGMWSRDVERGRKSSGGPMTMGYLAERSFLTPRNMKVQELLG